jgi:serine/threonine protein kinase
LRSIPEGHGSRRQRRWNLNLVKVFSFFTAGPRWRRGLDRNSWGPSEYTSIFSGVLTGLQFLHDQSVCHSDVKPRNIATPIDSPLVARILDFGSSWVDFPGARPSWTSSTLDTDVPCYTMQYRPPEVILGAPDWGCRADIWACGVTLGSLLKPLFLWPSQSESPWDVLFAAFKLLGTPKGPSLVFRSNGYFKTLCASTFVSWVG